MTAERICVIVQQICNHAIRNLLVTTKPTQPLRCAIARAPVEHHRHPSEKELGALGLKLDDHLAHATTIAAIKLLLLTMTRKSELLRWKWPEFDLGRDVVELLPAHSAKNATVAAYSHMELAADRKRALQYLADRV